MGGLKQEAPDPFSRELIDICLVLSLRSRVPQLQAGGHLSTRPTFP